MLVVEMSPSSLCARMRAFRMPIIFASSSLSDAFQHAQRNHARSIPSSWGATLRIFHSTRSTRTISTASILPLAILPNAQKGCNNQVVIFRYSRNPTGMDCPLMPRSDTSRLLRYGATDRSCNRSRYPLHRIHAGKSLFRQRLASVFEGD